MALDALLLSGLIEQAGLLPLTAKHCEDSVSEEPLRANAAKIKAIVPDMTSKLIDCAVLPLGDSGTNNDHGVALALATTRPLQLVVSAEGLLPRTYTSNHQIRLTVRT